MESLSGAAFAPQTTYLNTASSGLLPADGVAAVQQAVAAVAAGRAGDMFADVEAARAAFARIVGVPASRVAAGDSVAVYTGLIAASLPVSAEVLLAEDDFSSLVTPFHVRADLRVRKVPLEELAEAVRPGTDLVALSLAQSADGRIADLDAIRAAARAHGARTLVDVSQAAGWLPYDASEDDFAVAVAFKWLLCPRGVTFLVVPEDLGSLTPYLAGWVAGEVPFDSCYGPVHEFAHSARRFDVSPSLLSYVGARHGLDLVEKIGVEAVHAHDTALADRFREGLDRLGHTPVHAPGSAIVSVPGLGFRQQELSRAGVEVSDRAGNLRAAFHLYNSAADVDRLLDVLSG
ncbi:aminotransferase class V-fold PLP-dependent enzyme [Streptomyces cavernicola]|uniref:Aminotransferase class V-fold PLP-dependent enzyme n=1 Tax=Streptomyces cavernicola TaxID=3043613 RepID=A0ABT6S9R0_9ACTN|nr:aminotransferase class V-fold PLP-dependent enzyme [Streptomyces sp. B-S-A6]MDI3404885.1 aminotransferase class V-fold PLP-dependent enzyme [Streptomyces sp. B-S-A6]